MHPFSRSVPARELAVFLGRAAMALLLGGLVGAERRWRSRMAGLRTNPLVALGAALFELLSLLLAVSPTASLEHEAGDFTRVTASVVSGVGFLGALGVVVGHVALQAVVSRLSLEPALAAVSRPVADDRRPEDLDG
jgi:putative Mg2+ transporter-C (MgtC) family protein